jgi:hypothetical protein
MRVSLQCARDWFVRGAFVGLVFLVCDLLDGCLCNVHVILIGHQDAGEGFVLAGMY